MSSKWEQFCVVLALALAVARIQDSCYACFRPRLLPAILRSTWLLATLGSVVTGTRDSCSGYAGFRPCAAPGKHKNACRSPIYARFCVIPGLCPRWALCRSRRLRRCFRTSFFGFGQGKTTKRLTELFWRLFFSIKFPLWHWYALIIMGDGKSHSEINAVIEFREPFTSPGCSSRLAGPPVPGSSRVHLVKKFTENIPQWVPFNDSFCIILPMALLLERWIVTMSRVTSRELIILYYSFVASHLHVTCSCFSFRFPFPLRWWVRLRRWRLPKLKLWRCESKNDAVFPSFSTHSQEALVTLQALLVWNDGISSQKSLKRLHKLFSECSIEDLTQGPVEAATFFVHGHTARLFLLYVLWYCNVYNTPETKNSFGDFFFSIPKFPLWHCYGWFMGNPILKSINVVIEFRAERPLYIIPSP